MKEEFKMKEEFNSNLEFLKKFRNDYLSIIIREGNKKRFKKNPKKYKRLGLNEYLEEEEKIINNVIISKDKAIKLNKNFILKVEDDTNTSISIDNEFIDRDTIMVRIIGTLYNINCAIGYLKEKIENIPLGINGEVCYIKIPKNRISTIIGFNGANLTHIQDLTGVKIALVPEENSNKKRLAIYGTEEQIKKAKNLIYKNQFVKQF